MDTSDQPRITIARVRSIFAGVDLMLFMVIEHFNNGDPKPIRDRFIREGRMMPNDIIYHASWIDPNNARCFQIMEAAGADALKAWTDCWDDLIEFEIIPVLGSQDYWSQLSE